VDDLLLRVTVLLNVIVPLLLFMAWIYLGLHIVFARLITRPDSPILWFFSIVTGPLTRPVRALMPAGSPERRVRTISFVAYVLLWLAVRVLFLQLAGRTG
jgi:hypothetical protein